MRIQISDEQWRQLQSDGYLRLPGACADMVAGLLDGVRNVLSTFPHGFAPPHHYSGIKLRPLDAPSANGRIVVPSIGFFNPELLRPLDNPDLHRLIERIVGKNFYLSSTWYQEVPPGTQRLAYHKDVRGSISMNILLDRIGPGMGSTCLVPGSHINTPPADYCMSHTRRPHPREIDLTGEPGDVVLFSTETWHGRSEHRGTYRTRRLFYNFYSRSSRETTTWSDDVIDNESIERARAVIPPAYQHMFAIDAARTRALRVVPGTPLRKWAYARSSSDKLVRDAVYARYAYGQNPYNEREPEFLLPFMTALTASRPYSAREYFGHLRLVPTMRNSYSALRDAVLKRIRSPRLRPAA
jgi:Phytanoyl-CoA dioxygenase (PhyH)